MITGPPIGAPPIAAVPDPVRSPNGYAGCAWRAAPAEDPHGSLYDRLNSVAVVSPREAWAVGEFYTGREGGPTGAFVERWDGRRWREVAARIPRRAILWSVSASGAGDVWAVGQSNPGGQLIEHWDGSAWRTVPPPPHQDGILFAVAASSPDDVWAVGARRLGAGGRTLVEHWNGRRWSVVPSPDPAIPRTPRPYAVLRAVTGISPTDVWAAGYAGGVRSLVTHTLIEHWNGRRWRIVPSPIVRSSRGVINNLLFSISGDRREDVWAVGSWGSLPGGYGGKGDHALAMHWNGRRWSRVATPPVAQRGLLSGVIARGGHAWAVGDQGLQPRQRTLIARFDGSRWRTVASPRGSSLAAIAASSAGPVWTVGASGRRPLAARC